MKKMKKWMIRFNLPKLYTGEKWFKVAPLSISFSQGELKDIESVLNIYGFFIWQLYVFYNKDDGFSLNLSILGFELNVYYE